LSNWKSSPHGGEQRKYLKVLGAENPPSPDLQEEATAIAETTVWTASFFNLQANHLGSFFST